MGWTKTTLSLAIVAASLAATSASALTIQTGDYIMILQNLDSATTGYGNSPGTKCTTVGGCDAASLSHATGSIGSVNTSADTMGIFSIQSITAVGSLTPYFTAGGADGFLTGVFGNLQDYNVNVSAVSAGSCSAATPGGCVTSAKAVGGTFSIYQNAAAPNTAAGPGVAAGKDLNAGLYPSISGGSLFLSGIFAPGAIFGDLTTTFQSTFNNGSIAGGSSGYLDITGGSAQALFDTNGKIDPNGGIHDAFADFTFSQATGASATSGWTVQSSAQVNGSVGNKVPEPGSIGLIGLGGVVAGLLARRRKPIKN